MLSKFVLGTTTEVLDHNACYRHKDTESDAFNRPADYTLPLGYELSWAIFIHNRFAPRSASGAHRQFLAVSCHSRG
jgi:hypothetical protein